MFNIIDEVSNNINPDFAGPGYDSVSEISAIALNFMMAISFSFGIVAITYGFVSYVLSGGAPEKTKKAWYTIIYGLVGAMIGLATVVLKDLALGTLNLSEEFTKSMINF